MTAKTIWTVVGFLLFATGMLALVMSIVGVEFIMNIRGVLGDLTAFLLKVGMAVIGVVIMALASTDWEQSDDI